MSVGDHDGEFFSFEGTIVEYFSPLFNSTSLCVLLLKLFSTKKHVKIFNGLRGSPHYLPISAVKVYLNNSSISCNRLVQDPMVGHVKKSFYFLLFYFHRNGNVGVFIVKHSQRIL